MKKIQVNDELWLVVKVERGFPALIKAFFTENAALKQERVWRKQMNRDYDETGIFYIKAGEIGRKPGWVSYFC